MSLTEYTNKNAYLKATIDAGTFSKLMLKLYTLRMNVNCNKIYTEHGKKGKSQAPELAY